MIRLQNLDPLSGIHPSNQLRHILIPAASATSLAAALTMNVAVAGDFFTLANSGWVLGDPCSVALTTGGGAAATASVRILGINQFNKVVTETITLAGVVSGSTVQSTNCYKRLLQAQLMTIGVLNAATISIGVVGNVTTDATTRIKIALPFQVNNPAITAGTAAQNANGAEWIQALTAAGVAINISAYDSAAMSIQSTTSLTAQVIYLRFNFANLGARFA